MRKHFEQENKLDVIAIPDVKLDHKSRHEMAPLLAALQYIFITPSINEKIFSILEEKILKGKKATGRLGMSLWEILVLGSVRLSLNTNYDALHDLANFHAGVRGILGVQTIGVFDQGKEYKLTTLKDNVRLLDEQTLKKINIEIVKAGHEIKKKRKKSKRT